ncbi:MAG: B12-binding domain-containing radical SAM protein, partial [Candidatus Aenigmatarchaeota archaeon]
MRILMLNPPFLPKYSRASRSPAVTKGGTIYYPLWLAYATGAAEKAGFEVKLVDAPADDLNVEDVVRIAKEFRPDLTVLETSTPSVHNDVKVAEAIKDATNCFILVVGTHPSVLAKDTLKMSKKIDAVGRKEYDHIVRELALALQDKKPLNKVRGLSYIEKGKVKHNPDMPYIENLDELPFVSEIYKKHLSIKNYFFAAAEYPMVMIFSGRGCPNMCFFCLYPQTFGGRRYRLRSAENVVAEFEYIINNLPEVKEIGIEDDTFSADLERVHK